MFKKTLISRGPHYPGFLWPDLDVPNGGDSSMAIQKSVSPDDQDQLIELAESMSATKKGTS